VHLCRVNSSILRLHKMIQYSMDFLPAASIDWQCREEHSLARCTLHIDKMQDHERIIGTPILPALLAKAVV